ncbi:MULTISPECIES: hypothetical protein [unclassified Bradyrhizobium]|uniref:hypothetical protein n=1 Tax=unclassified Bradyrhizobium TaxID=2631580 RepID=UPI001CD59B0D|nr:MULTISPECIES: hypothetical protein [unclassified Bradyrhizobium]MCA1376393.1 hypothetical protein [Bradyrhizobium sp. IC4060]MCA1487160.1 hypothetical protein [Bradyrhizobium sp. IC4061]MCA1542953.1 hypothetical protein [Bradyrhizobium sp. NBAIM32]
MSPGLTVDDFAGALAPPLLASDDVLRLEAPAPVVPPVPVELMPEPVLDGPAPLCAKAEGDEASAAMSPAMTSAFMSAPVLGLVHDPDPEGRTAQSAQRFSEKIMLKQ